MKRTTMLIALVLAASPAWAEVNTTFGFHMDISNAPPAPRVAYVREPRLLPVPDTRVYVVDDDECDHDYFRYGTYWYVQRGGWWYRARAWRGPFMAIRASAVPPVILNVPARYWRHHPHGGPPGQMKKRGDVVLVSKSRRGPDVVVVKNGNGKGKKSRDRH